MILFHVIFVVKDREGAGLQNSFNICKMNCSHHQMKGDLNLFQKMTKITIVYGHWVKGSMNRATIIKHNPYTAQTSNE